MYKRQEQLVEVENLIGDSGRELRCYLDSLSFEPEQFYETESRLNQINHPVSYTHLDVYKRQVSEGHGNAEAL